MEGSDLPECADMALVLYHGMPTPPPATEAGPLAEGGPL